MVQRAGHPVSQCIWVPHRSLSLMADQPAPAWPGRALSWRVHHPFLTIQLLPMRRGPKKVQTLHLSQSVCSCPSPTCSTPPHTSTPIWGPSENHSHHTQLDIGLPCWPRLSAEGSIPFPLPLSSFLPFPSLHPSPLLPHFSSSLFSFPSVWLPQQRSPNKWEDSQGLKQRLIGGRKCGPGWLWPPPEPCKCPHG